MKVYISGAISGLPFDNVVAKFSNAATVLKNMGFDPVSPLDNGLTKDHSWMDHMVRDLEILQSCDAICMLGCHGYSTGAIVEKIMAWESGIHVIHIDSICGDGPHHVSTINLEQLTNEILVKGGHILNSLSFVSGQSEEQISRYLSKNKVPIGIYANAIDHMFTTYEVC